MGVTATKEKCADIIKKETEHTRTLNASSIKKLQDKLDTMTEKEASLPKIMKEARETLGCGDSYGKDLESCVKAYKFAQSTKGNGECDINKLPSGQDWMKTGYKCARVNEEGVGECIVMNISNSTKVNGVLRESIKMSGKIPDCECSNLCPNPYGTTAIKELKLLMGITS